MKLKYQIILILIIISLIGSILTLTEKQSNFCKIGNENQISGCSIVQQTSYASTLGIKNSYYGIVLFSILFLINLKQIYKPTKRNKIILSLGILGATVVAIYFLYIQYFIIHTICNYCMIVDISTLIMFATQFIIKDSIKLKENKQE